MEFQQAFTDIPLPECHFAGRCQRRKIGPQPGLVELPVAVLSSVEQHYRQPVAELGAQSGITRGGSGVDVGGRQVEAELVGQLAEPGRGPLAQGAALPGQQHHLRPVHVNKYPDPGCLRVKTCTTALVTKPPFRRWPVTPAPRPRSRTSLEEEAATPLAPPPDLTAAAFFDVDNTMVHGSSLVHFARGLAARKYFTYGDMVRFIYAQAKFQLTGRENSDDVAAGRRKALAFIEGRSTAELVAVGEEIFDDIIADKIWPGTRALAQMHLDAGQQVWLVTATPYELAATIANRLGLTGALGTVAESVDGVFTGRLVGDILHGTGKAHAVRSLAIREGLNLRRCTAYSDSFNDVPMLSLVGTAVAINPDAALRDLARERGWEIRDFRTARKAARIGVPSALALGAAGGALAAVVSRRHDETDDPPAESPLKARASHGHR